MVRTPRFDPAWQRRRRWRRRWRTARRWAIGLAVLAVVVLLAVRPDWQRMSIWPSSGDWQAVDMRFTACGEGAARACVVDGDTVVVGRRRIRLTGFDAPERDGACEAERLLAVRARDGLRDWLNRDQFEWDGGADPPRDRWGRELRTARRRDGSGTDWLDLAMVESGLARRSGFAGDWCAD